MKKSESANPNPSWYSDYLNNQNDESFKPKNSQGSSHYSHNASAIFKTSSAEEFSSYSSKFPLAKFIRDDGLCWFYAFFNGLFTKIALEQNGQKREELVARFITNIKELAESDVRYNEVAAPGDITYKQKINQLADLLNAKLSELSSDNSISSRLDCIHRLFQNTEDEYQNKSNSITELATYLAVPKHQKEGATVFSSTSGQRDPGSSHLSIPPELQLSGNAVPPGGYDANQLQKVIAEPLLKEMKLSSGQGIFVKIISSTGDNSSGVGEIYIFHQSSKTHFILFHNTSECELIEAELTRLKSAEQNQGELGGSDSLLHLSPAQFGVDSGAGNDPGAGNNPGDSTVLGGSQNSVFQRAVSSPRRQEPEKEMATSLSGRGSSLVNSGSSSSPRWNASGIGLSSGDTTKKDPALETVPEEADITSGEDLALNLGYELKSLLVRFLNGLQGKDQVAGGNKITEEQLIDQIDKIRGLLSSPPNDRNKSSETAQQKQKLLEALGGLRILRSSSTGSQVSVIDQKGLEAMIGKVKDLVSAWEKLKQIESAPDLNRTGSAWSRSGSFANSGSFGGSMILRNSGSFIDRNWSENGSQDVGSASSESGGCSVSAELVFADGLPPPPHLGSSSFFVREGGDKMLFPLEDLLKKQLCENCETEVGDKQPCENYEAEVGDKQLCENYEAEVGGENSGPKSAEFLSDTRPIKEVCVVKTLATPPSPPASPTAFPTASPTAFPTASPPPPPPPPPSNLTESEYPPTEYQASQATEKGTGYFKFQAVASNLVGNNAASNEYKTLFSNDFCLSDPASGNNREIVKDGILPSIKSAIEKTDTLKDFYVLRDSSGDSSGPKRFNSFEKLKETALLMTIINALQGVSDTGIPDENYEKNYGKGTDQANQARKRSEDFIDNAAIEQIKKLLQHFDQSSTDVESKAKEFLEKARELSVIIQEELLSKNIFRDPKHIANGKQVGARAFRVLTPETISHFFATEFNKLSNAEKAKNFQSENGENGFLKKLLGGDRKSPNTVIKHASAAMLNLREQNLAAAISEASKGIAAG